VKDRVKSRVWTLVGVNALVLIVVLGLSYAAGSQSGGLSLLDFGQFSRAAGLEFLAALFLVLAASLALLLQLGSKVVKPTRELMEFSEKLMEGDYETRANVTPDDFGVIAENWNRAAEMVAQAAAIKAGEELLRSDLAELEKIINQVSRGDLAGRAPAAAHPYLTAVTESFNVLADNYARRMERARAASADIASLATQLIAAASDMGNGASQQEQVAMDAAAAIAQLTASTQKVCGHATSAQEAARRALDLSDQGGRAVHESAEGMQRISAAMQATAEKIKSLASRSLEVYEVINLIHETNLLAQNAMVESSRGGQAGQTMEVLSAELRKLADHSRSATRDIVNLLKSIQAESNEAVTVMEQGNRVAQNGAQLMEQANRAFTGLATVLHQTADFAEAISGLSSQQVQGTENVTAAVQEIAADLRQNSTKARQSAKIVEQVVRSSEQLTQAVTQFRPAQVPPAARTEKPEAVPAAVIGRA
jgi:methyl-accepting chemotaxis protein